MAKNNKPNTPDADAILAAAKAEQEAEAARVAALANNAALREQVLAQVEVFGRQAGRGEGGLTNAAIMFASAVARRILALDNAKDVYLAYLRGYNARVKFGEQVATDDKSIAPTLSTFRTFGKPAPVAQGAALYEQVMLVVRDIPKDARYGSMYNCFVRVNRGLDKLGEKTTDNGASLPCPTDEQIADWCTKPVRAEKDDLQKLQAVIETLRKLAANSSLPRLDEQHAALVAYAERVVRGEVTPLSHLVALGGVDTGEQAAIH